MLLLLLKEVYLVDSLHYSLLHHLDAALQSPVFSYQSLHLHLFLSLKHVAGLHLLFDGLHLVLCLKPLVLERGHLLF